MHCGKHESIIVASKQRMRGLYSIHLNNCCILFVTDIILNTMRNEGNVLISVDTAGRVVELSLLLVSKIWSLKQKVIQSYEEISIKNIT